MQPTITMITLGVSDLSRSRAFYTAMGWQETPLSQESIAFFRGTGAQLALWPRDELAADSGVHEDRGGWGGITIAHNVDSTEKVDSIVAAAAEAGASVVRTAGATEWGGYSAVIADLDGHRWEIAYPPLTAMEEEQST